MGLADLQRLSQYKAKLTTLRRKLEDCNSLPNLTNTTYDSNLEILLDINLPGAGHGLRILKGVTKGSIIGIYENATGGKRKSSAWI